MQNYTNKMNVLSIKLATYIKAEELHRHDFLETVAQKDFLSVQASIWVIDASFVGMAPTRR